MSATPRPAPAAAGDLVRHSRRLGRRWLARTVRSRHLNEPRAGLYRLLVPLEPWRYYELARVAEEPFSGDCLDISSPKLLASHLNAAGRGRWTAVDLFSAEIDRWRVLDPALDLRVMDARSLDLPDASVDAIACVSVIEHIADEGDRRAMAEMWRVLRPGGVLHLTTNVAAHHTDVWVNRRVWGEASEQIGDRVFFERRYSAASLSERLLDLPWEEQEREYVRERRPLHERFFAARPWSFAAGPLLGPLWRRNFLRIDGPQELAPGAHAAVYLRLRRPAAP